MSDIIGFEELQEKLGGRTPAEVAARLTAVGISYIRGKNGKPWTTIDAINWSLGVGREKPKRSHAIQIEVN